MADVITQKDKVKAQDRSTSLSVLFISCCAIYEKSRNMRFSPDMHVCVLLTMIQSCECNPSQSSGIHSSVDWATAAEEYEKVNIVKTS